MISVNSPLGHSSLTSLTLRHRLRRSTLQHLSICWNDVLKKISYKRYDLVKSLQVKFATIDFSHLHDLHRRWNFLRSEYIKYVFNGLTSLNCNCLALNFINVVSDLRDNYVVAACDSFVLSIR